MYVIEILDSELVHAVSRAAKDAGITDGAIVSLIGSVDSFTVSTMPRHDPTAEIVSRHNLPAEIHGTGEITDGTVHIHATMAVEGDHAIAGHLHSAEVTTWFVRAYVVPLGGA
jgi:predicted DNA-binding protein with PD1-like motif